MCSLDVEPDRDLPHGQPGAFAEKSEAAGEFLAGDDERWVGEIIHVS